jgi:signal peptidase II
MRRPLSKWALLGVLAVVLLLVDQWTKFLAVDRLTVAFDRGGDVTLAQKLRGFYAYEHLEPLATNPHYVFRAWWRMKYVENPGAAWGLFRSLPEGARNVLFTVISLGAVAFIVHYYRRIRSEQRFLQVALAFVLAGALGNFADRIARGYVIDFIDWYWWNRPDLYWPTFNIADSLIVVGVAMLLVHPGEKKAAAADRDRTAAGA